MLNPKAVGCVGVVANQDMCVFFSLFPSLTSSFLSLNTTHGICSMRGQRGDRNAGMCTMLCVYTRCVGREKERPQTLQLEA